MLDRRCFGRAFFSLLLVACLQITAEIEKVHGKDESGESE